MLLVWIGSGIFRAFFLIISFLPSPPDEGLPSSGPRDAKQLQRPSHLLPELQRALGNAAPGELECRRTAAARRISRVPEFRPSAATHELGLSRGAPASSGRGCAASTAAAAAAATASHLLLLRRSHAQQWPGGGSSGDRPGRSPHPRRDLAAVHAVAVVGQVGRRQADAQDQLRGGNAGRGGTQLHARSTGGIPTPRYILEAFLFVCLFAYP